MTAAKIKHRVVSKKRTPSLPRTGIIDIGSSTVRLVVYEGTTALSAPLFNEKVHCELARGLAATGRLNPDGRVRARAALARFVRLARAMGAERIEAVATAAVREARDGDSFVAQIKRRFAIPVRVLSGTEEARLSAFGLLANVPDADGLLGDLGGGSLELVELDRGRIGQIASLMLGHIVLAERADGSRKRARNVIDRDLATLSWLRRREGRDLYVTGGSWRTIARILLEQTRHPLHIIDGYEIEAGKVSRVSGVLSDLSTETLLKIESLPPRRAETLPFAALVLQALIDEVRPKNVVFSGFGIREGALLSAGPGRPARKRDLLVEGAAAVDGREHPFALGGAEIGRWLDPLFRSRRALNDALRSPLSRGGRGGAAARERKLRLVVGHLADVARFEHPDYRAEQALARVLRLPLGGLSHADRAYAALAVFIRYNGTPDSPQAKPYRALLDDDRLRSATALGLALRLAYALSGGAPGLLRRTPLKIADRRLVLTLPRVRVPYWSDAVERRLRSLARALDLEPKLR